MYVNLSKRKWSDWCLADWGKNFGHFNEFYFPSEWQVCCSYEAHDLIITKYYHSKTKILDSNFTSMIWLVKLTIVLRLPYNLQQFAILSACIFQTWTKPLTLHCKLLTHNKPHTSQYQNALCRHVLKMKQSKYKLSVAWLINF